MPTFTCTANRNFKSYLQDEPLRKLASLKGFPNSQNQKEKYDVFKVRLALQINIKERFMSLMRF